MDGLIAIAIGFFLASLGMKILKRWWYEKSKERWKQKNCYDRNQHFVGESAYADQIYCEVCGKKAKMLKNGAWKW